MFMVKEGCVFVSVLSGDITGLQGNFFFFHLVTSEISKGLI